MKLTQHQINKLEQLLESHNPDDALNFTEVHGLMTALKAGPIHLEPSEKINFILYGDPRISSEPHPIADEVISLINTLDREISAQLLSGDTLKIPCTLALGDSHPNISLQDWLTGFFDAFFLDEELWYKENEEDVAQILLPFFACFDDLEDNDLEKIRTNKNLLQKMANEIPFALQDLYLFFNNRNPLSNLQPS